MTLLGKVYRSDEISHDDEYEIAQEGLYDLELETIELRDNRNTIGKHLNCRFKIIAPLYQGVCVFDIINVENPSEMTEKIGEGKFKKIVKAANIVECSIDDRVLLIGTVLGAYLTVEEYQGKRKNKITKFYSKPQFLNDSVVVVSGTEITETNNKEDDFDDQLPF